MISSEVERKGLQIYLRVDDEVDVDARADEGAGDGIDQEGHVVGDDLDDGSGVGPAVDLGRRVVDPHVRHAGMPVARQGEVAGRRAGIDVGGARRELVEGHVAEVARDEFGSPAVRYRLLERFSDRGEDVLAGTGLGARHGAVALLGHDSPGAVGHAIVSCAEPIHFGPPCRPDTAPNLSQTRDRAAGECGCYDCYRRSTMKTIAHRELRNNSSAVLARVAAGEAIAVTNHGEVAAVLVPPAASALERVLQAQAARLPRSGIKFSAIDRVHGASTVEILDDLRGDR